jgi:hypothetical protein
VEIAFDISLGESLMSKEGNIGGDSFAFAKWFREDELASFEFFNHFVCLLCILVIVDAANWCFWVFKLFSCAYEIKDTHYL